MYSLIVGEVAPEPFWPTTTKNGTRIRQSMEGWFCLASYLMDITQEEEDYYTFNEIKAKYIIDNTESLLLTIIRYDGTDTIHEIIYDPTIYPNDEWASRQSGLENCNNFLILLIDSSTGILRSMRRVKLPLPLWLLWIYVWGKALTINNYSKIYKEWLSDASTLPVMALWDLGQDVGYFGEDH